MKQSIHKTMKQLSKGYSLIELLVVITLIGIIGTITTEAFILGLKAQGKGDIVKEVKQNGDYATQVIESMVRNAVDIDEAQCNNSSQSMTIVNPDGFTTTFECNLANYIASISAVYPTPPFTQRLTSDKVVVPVDNCTFRIVCPTPPLSPKYVFVNFTVRQTGVNAPIEQRSSLEYQTTVSLRNYQ